MPYTGHTIVTTQPIPVVHAIRRMAGLLELDCRDKPGNDDNLKAEFPFPNIPFHKSIKPCALTLFLTRSLRP